MGVVLALLSCGEVEKSSEGNRPSGLPPEPPYEARPTTMSYESEAFRFRLKNITSAFRIDEARVSNKNDSYIEVWDGSKKIAAIEISSNDPSPTGGKATLLGQRTATIEEVGIPDWDASTMKGCIIQAQSGDHGVRYFTITLRASYKDWFLQNWQFLE